MTLGWVDRSIEDRVQVETIEYARNVKVFVKTSIPHLRYLVKVESTKKLPSNEMITQ